MPTNALHGQVEREEYSLLRSVENGLSFSRLLFDDSTIKLQCQKKPFLSL